MDGPKFGRAGARRPAARIGGWRPKNWKSGDQSRCRERPEFGNDPELEQCGPKIGKARQPAASGGSRRLEKSVFKYHKYCVEDGLSVDTPECRSGVSFLPAPADPPPTRRLPGPPASAGCPAGRSFPPASREFLPAADPPSHWLPRRSPPPLPVAAPAAPSRRPLGSSSPPTPTRRPTGCSAGRSFPSASREFLSADADPSPPGATGFDWLPRRSPPPLPVAAPAAPSRRPLGSSSPPTPTRRPTGCSAGRSFPSASREFLSADADPSPPGATGFDWLPRRSPPPLPVAAPAAPSRRTLGSSSPPTPTRRLPGPPVSTGCCAGLFFPPAIPIDPPVSPFAGPPRRTGGVCLPFGRNGGRKCRSRLEYCAEFSSFVTPKHQYHEKPPPRTLCVCGLLQCSAGRMLRA